MDVTGRWKKKLKAPMEALAGMDAFEVAAGGSYIQPNAASGLTERMVFRAGPAVYFGKQTRFQVNVEYDAPMDGTVASVFRIRSQATINF